MDFESHLQHVKKVDPEVYKWIKAEIRRQETTLELIPSENAASLATLEALGSVFNNKYSEGYPNARYYGGNEYVDEVENLARDRAKELYGVPHANVQPYSGSPANFAVYTALCEPGDTVLGHGLMAGGHLTHGWKSSATAKYFNCVQYGVDENGLIDVEEIRRLAHEHKPKMIWIGATAYSRAYPFEEVSKIADEVGAYLIADMSHFSGLVAGDAHVNPRDYVHVISSTTHKTLRGPRGGIIMATQKGLEKEPKLGKMIDKAIFPGLQGGPHEHQIAALAVTLGEALKPEFKEYAAQIVKNAQAMAKAMMERGMKLITDGTDNHLILAYCGDGKGQFLQDALDIAGITLNKNTIPQEPFSPFFPSGIRLGSPVPTTRGMKEPEMELIGNWIADVNEHIQQFEMPTDKLERRQYLKDFRVKIKEDPLLLSIRKKVEELCSKFPLYQ